MIQTNAELLEFLKRKFREIGEIINKKIKRADLTVSQFFLLAELVKVPQGIAVGELAKNLNLDRTTVSKMVERLVKTGFIKREKSNSDGRLLICMPTAMGKDAHATAKAIMNKKVDFKTKKVLEEVWDYLYDFLEKGY